MCILLDPPRSVPAQPASCSNHAPHTGCIVQILCPWPLAHSSSAPPPPPSLASVPCSSHRGRRQRAAALPLLRLSCAVLLPTVGRTAFELCVESKAGRWRKQQLRIEKGSDPGGVGHGSARNVLRFASARVSCAACRVRPGAVRRGVYYTPQTPLSVVSMLVRSCYGTVDVFDARGPRVTVFRVRIMSGRVRVTNKLLYSHFSLLDPQATLRIQYNTQHYSNKFKGTVIRIVIDNGCTREREPAGRAEAGTPALNRTHCHGTRTHGTRSSSPTRARVTRRGLTPLTTAGAGIGAVVDHGRTRQRGEPLAESEHPHDPSPHDIRTQGAHSAPPARAAVARARAAASVARRHRLDARLHAIDLPEQNDRGSAIGRGRAPKEGGQGERPIAHATPVLEARSGARAFGSGRGRAGSDISTRSGQPSVPAASGGVSSRVAAHQCQSEAHCDGGQDRGRRHRRADVVQELCGRRQHQQHGEAF